jgi:hypothetical protein
LILPFSKGALVDYNQLKNHIEKKMVIQHSFLLPASKMLKTLLQSKEYRASVEEIARQQFLMTDKTQLQ